MKAKIKTLTILTAIFCVSLIAGIFAGCIGETNPKEKADALGMTASVTYYTNGGNFVSGTNTTDGKSYRTDYYYPGTPIFNIGGGDSASGQSLNIKRTGYIFTGWAYALLDEDGLPYLYESDSSGQAIGTTRLEVLENGTASMIDSTELEKLEKEKRFVAVVDEERGLVFKNGHPRVGTEDAYEHVYLVATWEKDVVLEYKLITDAPITTQVQVDEIDEEHEEDYTVNDDGKIFKTVTYNNGDIFTTESFALGTSIELTPNTAPLSFSGFTYIHLYWDEAGTEAVVDGDTVTKHEDKTNSEIYAKYLSGNDWKTVKKVENVKEMFSDTTGKYFVVHDIDCSNAQFNYNEGNYGGYIEGNGKVLSNISISSTIHGNRERISLLGTVTKAAIIKNLVFENVNLELKIDGKMRAYVLVSDIMDGGVFENVLVNSVTFDITLEDDATLYNIQQDSTGAYKTDNWLYGKYATDAEFIENYGDFVRNATLIINGKEIVSGGQL